MELKKSVVIAGERKVVDFNENDHAELEKIISSDAAAKARLDEISSEILGSGLADKSPADIQTAISNINELADAKAYLAKLSAVVWALLQERNA